MTTAALPRQIAIDGPAASGKTTIARVLVERFGYDFLDTGLLYRAFTLAAQRRSIAPSDTDRCSRLAATVRLEVVGRGDARIRLDGEDVTDLLRDPEVERGVSLYSSIPEVRSALITIQRSFAERGRVVLAGRDIGTVVLPSADLKIYLDASEEARARRRSDQTVGWRVKRDGEASRKDITIRDRLDRSRSTSPLRPADGSVRIDTTDLTLAQVIERVVEEVQCAAC